MVFLKALVICRAAPKEISLAATKARAIHIITSLCARPVSFDLRLLHRSEDEKPDHCQHDKYSERQVSHIFSSVQTGGSIPPWLLLEITASATS
jgi:hypothetical protein